MSIRQLSELPTTTLTQSSLWLNLKKKFIKRLSIILDSPKRGSGSETVTATYPFKTKDNPRGVLCRFGTIWDFVTLDSTSEQGQKRINELNRQIQMHPELAKDVKIFLVRVRSIILRDYLNMTKNNKLAPISVQRAIYESYAVRKYLRIQKAFEDHDIQFGINDHRYVVDFLKKFMFRNLPDYQVKGIRKPDEVYHVNWFK